MVTRQSYKRLFDLWRFYRRVIPRDRLRVRKIVLFSTVDPYTMLSYRRLDRLYEIALHLEKEKINGSFVECGVWNGGSAGVVARVARNNQNRHVWLFDSWEGLPEPTEFDVDYKGFPGKKGMGLGSKEKAREILFKHLKLDRRMIHLVKGWFKETIPSHKEDVGNIALLHLDCDWYSSVKLCLEELYEVVVDGGFVVIDDYGHFKGCRKAVDEFITRRKLKSKLMKTDYTAVYLRKE